MAIGEELPEELITLILLKLPVKSLLRFKCVQKSWYSLIKSPRFTHLHRSSSTSSSSLSYDCFLVRRQNVLSFYSYETLDDLGNEINLPISVGAELCGSCDGLVCITNYIDQILICNPTIREFRSLSVPPPLRNRFGYRSDSVAFGSDPNTGQCKVVMIGVPYHDAEYDEDEFSDREAWLYDFSTDSWRETAVAIPVPFYYSRCAISFNGAFHWTPWDDSDTNILTFHISNEVTKFIPLPDFVVAVSHYKQLCVWSESKLSLIVYGLGDDYVRRVEIFVMTEYGVKESWTRLFNIRPLPNILKPIVFWDEQRLLLISIEGELVSCDLQHQNLRHFPMGGYFDLYKYPQSLVSVFGIGHPII